MQSYLPLKETADITSGCHMAVGSTTKLMGLLSFLGQEWCLLLLIIIILILGLSSVPDVQWMLQKGFHEHD